jgi:hypothetical protein
LLGLLLGSFVITVGFGSGASSGNTVVGSRVGATMGAVDLGARLTSIMVAAGEGFKSILGTTSNTTKA